MSTENSPQPIKTLDDWIRKVRELEERIDLATWPFPQPNEPLEPLEPDEPIQGPLP